MSTSCIRHASRGKQGSIPAGAKKSEKSYKTRSYVAVQGVYSEPVSEIPVFREQYSEILGIFPRVPGLGACIVPLSQLLAVIRYS
jgi:hypothetical protein